MLTRMSTMNYRLARCKYFVGNFDSCGSVNLQMYLTPLTYLYPCIHVRWGIYDIDDSCTGAKFLADSKQVDRKKLCIDGGSAGGYTTLAVLTFRDIFASG